MPVRIHDALTHLLVPMDSLSPHPKNPRNGDTDVIAASVRANGVYRPMIVQASTRHVIAGNHLYAVLMEEGAKEGPAVLVDVNDEHALRIMLADNRTSALGREDDGMLVELLGALENLPGGLIGTGYEPEHLDDLRALLDDSAWADDVSTPSADDGQDDDFRPRIDLRVSAEVFDAWQRWLNRQEGKDDVAKLARHLVDEGLLDPA